MIVWEWTIPPQYMHVQPVDATTPVPAEYLDEEKYDTYPHPNKSTGSYCTLYIDQDFHENFFAKIEHLPRIDDEWIKNFGIGEPTVIVAVYIDMPSSDIENAKELADRYFPNKFLTSEEGFDYL